MKHFVTIFSMLWLLVGCDVPTDNFIQVEEDAVYFGYEASTTTLKVRASDWWTASTDADWCDVTTQSGKLILDVEANDGEKRSTHVKLGCGDVVKLIYVSQRAYGVDAYVDVAERNMVVSSLADTLYIAVDATDHWTMEVEPQEEEWCSWVKTGNQIKVTYPTNMGKARTSTVNLVCGTMVTTITLTQQECENVLVAYFMGANNLSQALQNNIHQMEAAVREGALNGGRILIFFDQYVGSSIYELVDKAFFGGLRLAKDIRARVPACIVDLIGKQFRDLATRQEAEPVDLERGLYHLLQEVCALARALKLAVGIVKHQFPCLGDALIKPDVPALPDRNLNERIEAPSREVSSRAEIVLQPGEAVHRRHCVGHERLHLGAKLLRPGDNVTHRLVARLVILRDIRRRDSLSASVDPFFLLFCHVVFPF